MADKNLPIKFFQKRQKDGQDTEGGGERKIPAWADAGQLTEKSLYLRDVLLDVSATLAAKVAKNNYIPSVVKLKVNAEALAKTYRKEIGSIFNVSGKLNVIGVSGEDEVLIKVDNELDLQVITRKLANVNDAFPSYTMLIGISAITNAEAFIPDVDVEMGENNILKVKLFNYGNTELDAILIKEFERFCLANNLSFTRTAYSGELNIYRLDDVTTDTLEELRTFDGVQFVTEMPVYGITMDEMIDAVATIATKQPVAGVVYPIVGVLDTGIADIPHLSPWILEEKFTSYIEDDVNKRHGTFVAGILNYGDELEGNSYTGFDGCMLYEAIVMPDTQRQGITEDELISQIRQAISSNGSVKIWNLSLGSKYEADLYDFSDFAHALDEIQDEYDVLICKSAGNCENFRYNAPRSRISKSADTVRGLVVGSLTHDKSATDLAEKHHSSPFSRIGPGPSYLIKPDVVHMGGNAGFDARNNVVYNTVKSFSPDGTIANNVGTSFSTPRISAIAAGLNAVLNENFNPILLKALIIHSAKYPDEMKMGIAEKLNNVGFGMPSNIGDILFNQPNEITLILQDSLEKSNYIEIQDFPFPQSMIDDEGYFFGEITVTLVTAPILEKGQGAEYCQSNIEVMLGTYDTKVERDTTQPRVKNPIKADGKQNILATSVYSKKSVKDFEHPFASERMMLSYGDKYQPVKKWCVNLDEFTPTNKDKFLKTPKSWYLKLEGLFRHFTESKCDMQRTIPSQDFCLIITIKDTKKKGNIYNEVTRMLDNFSFVHNNIKINEEVRVRLNS
ncbi:MAG TPA: S8 family peptidase [Flavipsychrobacter sp.]|nr:S8 family peptidase [Flavipsychrobacter sp.]